MQYIKSKKLFLLLVILFLSVFLLTGCGGGGGGGDVSEPISQDNLIDEEVGYGYVDGYIHKTSDGDYVFNESIGSPVVNGIIEIDGSIYKTNNDGYFKSAKLKANRNYAINIVVEKNSGENFSYTENIQVRKNQTIRIVRDNENESKNWNIILFISDKSDSLSDPVDEFMNNIENISDLNNLNFFIIHGKFKDGYETNKAYKLTENGKKIIKNYGSIDFGNPYFYRNEIQDIDFNYPADKTMVTIFSHGNGWMYSENPGTPQNWLANDKAHDELGISTLDSYEIYDIFNNIGFEIDLFNFAACNMGQIEVISNLPDEVKYAMASPSFAYTSDLTVHKEILSDINYGLLNSEVLGEKYINYYVDILNDFNSTNEKKYPSVKALYDLKNVNYFVDDFKILSKELKNLFLNNITAKNKFKNEILYSNNNVQSYYIDSREAQNPTLVREKDLVGILNHLKNNGVVYGNNISNKADDLYFSLQNIILYSNNSDGAEPELNYSNLNKYDNKYTYNNSYGLSITVKKDLGKYNSTWFNQKTGWSDVLSSLLN
jgi:hypothetical protein